MTTNEFERDVNDCSFLRRPGRVDLVIFQNTPDAGDGHPGLQRCFRNYLHEGGMEKDLQLIGHGILGTSVNINNAELQQLSNIGSSVITASIWSQIDNIEATTISAAQWVFVGQADQNVRIADSPTFGGLTINGAITITGNVDGVDVSDLKSSFDTHKASTGVDHTYIDQSVVISTSPTFVGLTLSADLVTTSTIDSVDVSTFKTAYDAHAANTSNPHSVGLSQAFTQDKIIAEAVDEANAFQVGDGALLAKLYDGGLKLKSGSFVNEFSIDGTLAGNSDSAAPTEKAVKTYVTTHGWVRSGDIVFGPTNAPTAWQTLSLGSYVGSNYALVMLKVTDTTAGGNGYWFKPYGETDDCETDNHTGSAAGNAKSATNSAVIITCETNSVGNLEWMAVNTASTKITLLGYIKET